MPRRMMFALFSAALVFASFIPIAAASPPDLSGGPAKTTQFDPGLTGRFVVEFATAAKLGNAFGMSDRDARGEFVVDELKKAAAASQADVLRTIAATPGATAKSYWMRNTLVFEGNGDLATRILAMPGVSDVRLEKTYAIIRPVETHQVEPGGEIEWGVERIGAPEVWDQGIFGSGVVVASLDSGVDYLHPAIVDKYRGNNGDGTFTHDYNWFDASGDCPSDEPCDLLGHGTHTMGTMVGGDGPGPFTPDIGVAPGAQWISVSCGPIFCSESQLMEAGQWFLAPTDSNGENPDVTKRPDVINNSWGGGPGDPFFLDMVQAWRASGIVPVFAAGNPGPFCGEGGSPGDYNESYSVGAFDINDVIADFSGRGPSVFGKTNPNISAPGVDVISSVPGGGYESYSGTSMATPHVVGAVALVLSAKAELTGNVDGITSVLSATAIDTIDLSCGGAEGGDPNNVYGEGRLDAAAAVALAATGGTLTGRVTDAASGRPIAGARVVASNGERDSRVSTKADGTYKLFLQEGTYSVSAEAFAYAQDVVSGVEIVRDTTTVQDLALDLLPTGVVEGIVTNFSDGKPVKSATVTVLGTPLAPIDTRAGRYRITLPIGEYTLRASQGGCTGPESADVAVFEGVTTTQNFSLVQKIDDFGYGCAPLFFSWQDIGSQDSLFGDDNYGRLRLPFEFPFYGEPQSEVFITTNGYLTFTDPGYADYFNTAIPTANFPNHAVYALWQDLWVDRDATVAYQEIGRNAAVFQFRDVGPLGSESNLDFQIKLWKSGWIDIMYGDGMTAVGNGSSATVGLENADGSDGLQYSFREPLVPSRTGIRFERVPTGFAAGTVTNANDGLGVAGAKITAVPSGRTATSDADGNYQLRLVPGDYMLTATALNYEPETKPASIAVNRTTSVSFSLRAPAIAVVPDALGASVELGDTATFPVQISNEGSAILVWEAAGIETGATPPDLPPVLTADGKPYIRSTEWGRPDLPPELLDAVVVDPTFEGPLDTVIEDPIGDAEGPVDVAAILGGSDDIEASIEVVFTPDTPLDMLGGYVFLDTDRDPSTGLPPEALSGLPTQDIGMEYFADLFAASDVGVVLIIDAELFEIVAEVPAMFDGPSLRFDIPLEAVGDEDGEMDIAAVIGDWNAPSDWVPDVGHGTLSGGRPASWITPDPAAGFLEPGQHTIVNVTLGDPALPPGAYEGELRITSNDPRNPRLKLPTTLDVALPEDFGSLAGTVTDAFFGYPLAAEVTLTAGDYVTTTLTDRDGSYLLFGPEGEWPLTTTAEGHVTDEHLVTLVAGASVTEDVGLVPIGGIADVTFDDMSFSLGADEAETRTVTITNTGTADMSFSIFEFDLGAIAAAPPAAIVVEEQIGRRAVAGGSELRTAAIDARRYRDRTSQDAPAGYEARAVQPANGGGTWAVFMDALPFDSGALFTVLDEAGVVYDVLPSEAMADTTLLAYEVVVIANDQPQSFYDAYKEAAGRFEQYVLTGGVLWVGAASLGWNGGAFDGGTLPGGPPILDGVYEEVNNVVIPEHPLVEGVSNPFSGSFASHSGFDGMDADNLIGTEVITTGIESGFPTLVHYALGAGQVVASGQPLEFNWEVGEDGGVILVNMIPYLSSLVGPPPDVPWIELAPSDGVLAAGDTVTVEVTVSTTGLEPGFYSAELLIVTDDLFGAVFSIPVELEVVPGV